MFDAPHKRRVSRLDRVSTPVWTCHRSHYLRRQSGTYASFSALIYVYYSPLQVKKPPRSILIVNKLRTPPVVLAIDTLLEYVPCIAQFRHLIWFLDMSTRNIPECAYSTRTERTYPTEQRCGKVCEQVPRPRRSHRGNPGQEAEPIDLMVTLGGDGTILHASSLFSHGAVPPVLSFSMGTLGFLLPFRKSVHCISYDITNIVHPLVDIDDFDQALESVFNGKATILNRMRLSCTFYDAHLAQKEIDNEKSGTSSLK